MREIDHALPLQVAEAFAREACAFTSAEYTDRLAPYATSQVAAAWPHGAAQKIRCLQFTAAPDPSRPATTATVPVVVTAVQVYDAGAGSDLVAYRWRITPTLTARADGTWVVERVIGLAGRQGRSTGMKVGTVGVAVVVVIAVTITIALFGGQDDEGAAAKSSIIDCTPGSGLRAGAVPNGWASDVVAASAASGVPVSILAAQLEAESGWNPTATSGAGAQGLAQFMPATWAAYGEGDPFDAKAAIAAQGKYMGVLLGGVTPIATATSADPVLLALAAYNAGPARIAQYGGVPPFTETKTYVQKIPAAAQQTYAGDCTAPGVGPVVAPPGPGEWVPLPGGVLTSPFGMRWGVLHAGIDLAAPHAQPPGSVIAPVDLFITYAACGPNGYGCSVVGAFSDGTGFQMRFAHLATGSLEVKEGDSVSAGTALGTEGATGDVTGVHLHFEIYTPGSPTNADASNGTPVDPLPILTSKGVKIG